jgi:hypothetical protein
MGCDRQAYRDARKKWLRPKRGKFEGSEIIFLKSYPSASKQGDLRTCFEAWHKHFAIGSIEKNAKK